MRLTPINTNTVEPMNVKTPDGFKKKKRISAPIKEKYLCLCTKLNDFCECQKHPCNCCTTFMCGFAVYFWVGLFVTIASILSVIAYLSNALFMLNNYNNSYFAKCASNSDCNSATGLYCSKSNSNCKCPATNTYNRCDCYTGYFWNGTYCQKTMDYLDSDCSRDYFCNTTKGLQCINKTCNCQKPKIWFSALQRCDYVFVGCYSDTSTYTSFLTLPSTTEFRGYFVETCLEKCYSYSFKYVIFSYDQITKENRCMCGSTLLGTNSTVISCNICTSSVYTGGRICGNSTNSNLRSYYLVN